MSGVRRFVGRLVNFLRPARTEADLDRELASHLALLEDEFLRRGLSPEEARLQARRRLGGVDQAKERHRDERSFTWLEDVRRDLRHALRTLRRAPGFAASIVLTLGFGIGANTAMFNVINGVMVRPLEYPDADRLVAVLNRWTDTGRTQPNIAGGDEMDLAAQRAVFEAFAYHSGGEEGVQAGDHAELVSTQRVHPEFFRVFGLPPVAGRLFNPEDAERSAIVSLGFALRQFGGTTAALGRSISIAGRPYQIVGVMPAAMQFPPGTDVWAAAPMLPSNQNRSGHNYRAVARLAPGVPLETANARLSALGQHLAQAFPDSNAHKTFVGTPLRDQLVQPVRATLLVLMSAIGLVLLIACANVANLLLARGAARSRELAVRAALGAGRRHLVGQLLAESLVLAAAAGAIGLVLARVGTDALLRLAAHFFPLPRVGDVHIDWRVLLFTGAVSLLSAVGAGLVPALRGARVDVSEALNQSGARGTLGVTSTRVRSALVVAQIALSLTLAIDAGLLLRSFVALSGTPLGFRKEGVLVGYVMAPAPGSIFDKSGLDDRLRIGRLYDDLLARFRDMPDVTSTGAAMGLPTGGYDSNGSYAVEGKHVFAGDFRRLPSAGFRLASSGYFRTMGIPVLRGREFEDGDVYERPFVAVISESLARQTFGADDPIGHRIMCGFDSNEWMTIVGVVGDVRQSSPASTPGPELYMPFRQHPYTSSRLQVVIRTRVEPESLVGPVQQAVRATAPEFAMKFTTLEASVGDSIAGPRFRMALVSTFAILALILATAGMYAVMRCVTAQRTSEFGLRVALGARVLDVVGLVLRGATRLALAGAAIGVAMALLTSHMIASLLFGVTPLDAQAYLGVLLLALPVVLLAAALPALRVARVDPLVALRDS
jgi:putative ABC transport system permease protein